MSNVPVHYIQEAAVILKAQYDARHEIAAKYKVSPEKVILPDF